MSAQRQLGGPWFVVAGANPKNKTIIATGAAGQPAILTTRNDGFAVGCEPDASIAEYVTMACNSHEALVNTLVSIQEAFINDPDCSGQCATAKAILDGAALLGKLGVA